MSTTDNEDGQKVDPTPEVPEKSPNLADSKREQAKARRAGRTEKVTPLLVAERAGRPAKGATKAPAKKAAAKKAAAKKTAPTLPPRSAAHPRYTRGKYKAKEGETLYEATSRAGKINVRGSATAMTHAVDVADDKAPREEQRQGLIWGFFPDADKAEKAAKDLTAKGYNAIVVPATKYTAK